MFSMNNSMRWIVNLLYAIVINNFFLFLCNGIRTICIKLLCIVIGLIYIGPQEKKRLTRCLLKQV